MLRHAQRGFRAAATLAAWIALAGSAFAQDRALDAGLAFTDPEVMEALEQRGFGLGALLKTRAGIGLSDRERALPISNSALWRIRAMTPITRVVKAQIDTLPGQSLDPDVRRHVRKTKVDGEEKPSRLAFNPGFFDHPRSRFVLTGVINRMDRAYVKPRSCGEIRFLYRFIYDVTSGEADVASRLPLTLNLVMNAKRDGQAVTCAEIAQRWLRAGEEVRTPKLMAEYLRSADGPLSLLSAAHIDRIELNMQVLRLPAGIKYDFGGHAEYLLKVFRWDAQEQIFQEGKLENQIDRRRLLSDPAAMKAFKAWLFDADVIRDLDRGQLQVKDEFLAKQGVSIAPGGASRSQNRPFSGVVSDDELRDALAKYLKTNPPLETIKSAEGFKARLNDSTCVGCHQTRAIAGFHFIGSDMPDEPRTNAVFVPGSAHFLADMPRRRAIVEAFAARKRPEFTRGFSARPAQRYAAAFAGTQLHDGWGAVCHAGKDPSFASWTCAAGLKCEVLHAHGSDRGHGLGTCVSAGTPRIGDALERGLVTTRAHGDDKYARTDPPPDSGPPKPPPDRPDYKAAHQRYEPSDRTGGFPAGMLRLACCRDVPGEATCGLVAITGFNKCIASGGNHTDCIARHTDYAGLRACDQANPCREDYICTAPILKPGEAPQLARRTHADACEKPDASWVANRRKGTCIPPYFMFQFRVDGHPESFDEPDEE